MLRLVGSTILVISFALLNAVPAKADSILLYHVVGTITIDGNNTCSPAPCRQLINFAFNFGYRDEVVPLVPPLIIHFIPFLTNLDTDWVGPLGTFTSFQPGPIGISQGGSPFLYVPIVGKFGDEVDILFGDGRDTIDGHPPTITPPLFASELYSCKSAICQADFYTIEHHNEIIQLDAPMTKTIAAIPEPSTLALLGFGIAGIGTLKLKRRIRN